MSEDKYVKWAMREEGTPPTKAAMERREFYEAPGAFTDIMKGKPRVRIAKEDIVIFRNKFSRSKVTQLHDTDIRKATQAQADRAILKVREGHEDIGSSTLEMEGVAQEMIAASSQGPGLCWRVGKAWIARKSCGEHRASTAKHRGTIQLSRRDKKKPH